MWHRAANSNVVEDFRRAPLAVQPEDEAETRGALPEKVFNSQKVDFGASEKFFERCLSGKPFWLSPKPENTMAIPLAEGALSFCAGEYDKLQTLFLSRVVQPSTVLIGHDWLPSAPVGWVRNTWRWGEQVLLGHVKKSNGNRGTLEISDGDKYFEQWYVHDLDKWQTMPTEYSFKKVHGAGDLISTALRDCGHHCRHESAEASCLFRLLTSRQGWDHQQFDAAWHQPQKCACRRRGGVAHIVERRMIMSKNWLPWKPL